jgi:glycine/D-amino acid oxidase-like deaminating enzyme
MRYAYRCLGADVFGAEATGVLVDRNRVRGIRLSSEEPRVDLATDAVVIAAGINSSDLAAPFGTRLPFYPVKDYSITLQMADRAALRRHAI